MLSDPSFADSIRGSLQKMLSEDKKSSGSATKGSSHSASASKPDPLEVDQGVSHRHATTKTASSKSLEISTHNNLTKNTKTENAEVSTRNTPGSRPSSTTLNTPHSAFESPLTTEGDTPEKNLVTSPTPSNITKQPQSEIVRVETLPLNPAGHLPDVEMHDEPKK